MHPVDLAWRDDVVLALRASGMRSLGGAWHLLVSATAASAIVLLLQLRCVLSLHWVPIAHNETQLQASVM
eukprot:8701455-Lingulodinium_polyedra.AAC.1